MQRVLPPATSLCCHWMPGSILASAWLEASDAPPRRFRQWLDDEATGTRGWLVELVPT